MVNSFIPIMSRCRPWLSFDYIEVGIFSGGLIVMTVNSYINPFSLFDGIAESLTVRNGLINNFLIEILEIATIDSINRKLKIISTVKLKI